jgi:hypothetical protein
MGDGIAMTAQGRDLATAQHEAAHIVVGAALGMHMRRAVLEHAPGWDWSGSAWFDGRYGTNEAWALMLAAGIAWERAASRSMHGARGDLALLRGMGFNTRQRVRVLCLAAGAMLAGRGGIHARVTRALLDRDLDGSDFVALAHGQRPDSSL